MMYDELIKRLWERASGECFNCSQYTPTTNASVCQKELMKQAADAIEDLFAELRMEKVDNINLTGQLVEEHAKRKWISVKDRLPSQDGYYLVAYKLDVIPPRWHFSVYPFSLDLYNTDKFDFPRKKYKGKSGFYFYDSEYGYCEDDRVTHWMPLPEPPKEESYGV